MEDSDVRTLFVKLDAIIGLLVFRLAEGKSQKEQIRLLAASGFKPKEIAKTLETSANTVRVALSGLRRSRTKRRKLPQKK